ncbi:hypothetical protein SBOR_5618 [Sclerotinia borealis F-4128]|uniref:Cupin type-2 domain-containing protein n=1 Tax=Sclerotinia borealis (strain F-4128) TaxID=1432307 RepID=W9CB72_SCLBF|nr:hypothetical protein SBOR_5618 [Sclerotinia borealis F-4128]
MSNPIPTPIVPQPNVPIYHLKAEAGEVITLGSVKLRVMEDGSRTDNRISTVEGIVPAHMKGPPAHWHEMHDETFLVTKGVLTFWVPANPSTHEPAIRIDAAAGDYIVVPTRAPHTFSNETDQEARFFNTFTPAFYIHYFKLLASLMEEGKEMTPEVNAAAMAYYATIPVGKSK